jgi:hypothetical protein
MRTGDAPLTAPSRPAHARFMRRSSPDGKVKGEGARRFVTSSVMKRLNHYAIALGALAAPLVLVLSAKADLAQMNDGAPVMVITSSGGRISVHPGEPDGVVRIPGNPPGVQMSRFNVNPQTMSSYILPKPSGEALCRRQGPHGRQYFVPCGAGGAQPRVTPVQVRIPNLREGPHGVNITNPGGDLEVGVPTRMEMMLIKAGASPVSLDRTRGPYAVFGQNDVTMRSVSGNGWVVTQGNVDARDLSGFPHIISSMGRISVQSGPAMDRAIFYSRDGSVEWTINGVGGGPYRVELGTASARIYVRPGIGMNIDATSDSGVVVNSLDPSTISVGFAGQHAVSMTVGGGGPQITVHSQSGNVAILPAP